MLYESNTLDTLGTSACVKPSAHSPSSSRLSLLKPLRFLWPRCSTSHFWDPNFQSKARWAQRSIRLPKTQLFATHCAHFKKSSEYYCIRIYKAINRFKQAHHAC